MIGMNVDPLNPSGAPAPQTLFGLGVRWVRLVSRRGVEPYVQSCQQAGLMVLAVVTEESGGYLCPADCYQIGNEPDVDGTLDSMAPDTYVDYWHLYRGTYRDVLMIGAGLGAGQPDYWAAVQQAGGLSGAAGFGAHPYAKTATEARHLLQAYKGITPELPLWVDEWNRPVGEIPAFVAMLRQQAVMHAWFCWSDGMVPGFGLSPAKSRMLTAAA